MELDKRQQIRLYFDVNPPKFPSLNKWLLKASLITCGIGIFVMYFFQNTIIFGIACIFLSLLGIFFWLKPYLNNKTAYKLRPSEDQLYKWFVEDMNLVVKAKAVSVLAVENKKIKPENYIIVPYPIYWLYPGIAEDTIKRVFGKDQKFSYSIWGVQILAITENYISVYSCIYDWPNNNLSQERTNEYFFADISSVKNDAEQLPYKLLVSEEMVGAARIFKISNISGDSQSIITDIPYLQANPGTVTNLEKAVQVIRMILRNKRYGEAGEPEIDRSIEL